MTAARDASGSWEERTRWFREAKYGLFVHWGLYALPGRGEWIMYKEKIPIGEYERLAGRFKPGAFDPDAWVALAREAGMKYITFTSKHHDGFCTFDSALTDYTSAKRAAGRDLCAELAGACGRAGMPLFFYHSLPDWHHPDAADVLPGKFDFTMGRAKGEWSRYVDYLHGQVRELCTNYGRVAGIWFDMGAHWGPEHWRAEELCSAIRELQPAALINNRTGSPEDFGTPEEYIPGSAAEGAGTTGISGERAAAGAASPSGRESFFEVCLTTTKGAKAGNWGYNPEPTEIMSADAVLANLRKINGLGGNLLLNVGPDPEGRVPDAVARELVEAGRRLRGESR